MADTDVESEPTKVCSEGHVLTDEPYRELLKIFGAGHVLLGMSPLQLWCPVCKAWFSPPRNEGG
jgi:hypothetical protein